MRAVRSRIVIVIAAALAVAIFGVTRLFTAQDSVAEAAPTASLDGLNAQVTTAKWSTMDHDMSPNAPGYQMPPQMMPGMPEQGKQRLSVSVEVTNTSAETRPLRPAEEFALRAGEGAPLIAPHSDTFGDLPRLAPRNGIRGVLYFDLPADELSDSPGWIEWTHGGTTSRLTLPLNGVQPQPGHGH